MWLKPTPKEQLPSGVTFEDVVNGKTLSITFNADFGLISVIDTATGDQLTGVWSFWFAWQAFYPDTLVWSPSVDKFLNSGVRF